MVEQLGAHHESLHLLANVDGEVAFSDFDGSAGSGGRSWERWNRIGEGNTEMSQRPEMGAEKGRER